MNYSQFLDQIENLMHAQQVRKYEKLLQNKPYQWLIQKKTPLTILSTREECMIRHSLQKINEEQKQQVIKRLQLWLEEHPSAEVQTIPEICIKFLDNAHHVNLINNATLVRKHSFRRSLKRLSVITNKVFPMDTLAKTLTTRKCVHFRDEPTIFSITY